MKYLTTELVEQVHEAVANGRKVAGIVAGFENATLAGLLEYLCLRWTCSNSAIPELPQVIWNSELGRAAIPVLQLIEQRLGREHQRTPRNIGVCFAEFFALFDEEHIASQEWRLFTARFNRSTQQAGFAKKIADGLGGALIEMAENGILHSRSPIPVIAGYHISGGTAQFCVVDTGIGILASLNSCSDFAYIRQHNDAIRAALSDGVSRYGKGRGGLGFRAIFKSLAAQYGQLRFRSGEGCIVMNGCDLDFDRGEEQFPPALPGFQVSVSCRTPSTPKQ